MSLEPLDKLVQIGQLKAESPAIAEVDGLVISAMARLADGGNESLSIESRFDLIYNAAHSLSLAGLRWHGYRPANRYVVFQTLAHTLELPAAKWRVLAQAHDKRNRVEYEGVIEIDTKLVEAMLRVTREISLRIRRLTSR